MSEKQGTVESKPKPIWRRWWFWLVLLIAALVFAWKWVHRPDHKPNFYARVTLDMTVNDLPVHMERIITCKTIQAGMAPMGRRQPTEWVSWPRAFGEVLEDGSSVMVRTPYHCHRERFVDENGEERLHPRSLAPDYLPFIGWSPDGVRVEKLEVYISDAYFDRPDARIRDVQTQIELVDEDTVIPSEPGDFAWFSGLSHSERSNRAQVRFKTYAGWVLTEEQWKGRDAALDVELATYKAPAPVPSSFFVIEDIAKETYGMKRFVLPKQRWRGIISNELGEGLPFAGMVYYGTGARNLNIFSIQDSVINLDIMEAKGLLILERTSFKTESSNPRMQSGGIEAKTVAMGGRVIETPGSKYFYDPKTRRLILTNIVLLTGWSHKDHPLFTPPESKAIHRGETE